MRAAQAGHFPRRGGRLPVVIEEHVAPDEAVGADFGKGVAHFQAMLHQIVVEIVGAGVFREMVDALLDLGFAVYGEFAVHAAEGACV